MRLAEKLEEIREGSKERIPEKVRNDMGRATEELRSSGIVERVLNAGETMPEFELPNIAGEKVMSSELVRPEGIVVTFYRGVW